MRHDYFRKMYIIHWSYEADIFSAEPKLCENADVFFKFYVLNCHFICEDSSFLMHQYLSLR